MVPTSLPGGMPAGIVRVRPSVPRDAMRSILGLCAASSGVLPPSSSHGQSAMPSPWMMTYFNVSPPLKANVSLDVDSVVAVSANPANAGRNSVVQNLEDLRDVRLDQDRIAQVFHGGIRILQAMPGERADRYRPRFEAAAGAELQQSRDRCRRRRLRENAMR